LVPLPCQELTDTRPAMNPYNNDPAIVRLFGSGKFWLACVTLVFGVSILRAVTTELPKAPAKYGLVPEFVLTDQSNEAYGSDKLRGKIWVANFIFTRCTTVCPIFSGKMSELQKRTNKASRGLQLVSFSVDPDYDTPEVLKEYSKRFSANPWYWHFLTGATEDVRSVVVDGMKTFMGDAAEVDAPDALMHGSHFVLIDPSMNIRGFYQVDDEKTVERLLTDIQMVITEGF
jgi:protein SCO1/2